jgi:hypothetical protein
MACCILTSACKWNKKIEKIWSKATWFDGFIGFIGFVGLIGLICLVIRHFCNEMVSELSCLASLEFQAPATRVWPQVSPVGCVDPCCEDKTTTQAVSQANWVSEWTSVINYDLPVSDDGVLLLLMASWKLFTALPLLQAASPRPRAKVTSRHIIVIYSLWYLYNIHNICCSLPFTNQFACGRLRFQILHQSTRTWIHRIRPGRSIDLILVVHVSKRSQSSGATTWRPRSPSVFWWANQDLCRSEPWSRLIVLSMDCSKGFIITNNVWTWGPWNRDPKPIHFC